MVTRFQHIGRQHRAAVYHILLSILFRIAAHEEAVIPIGQADAHGPVVQVISVIRCRSHNGEGGCAQGIGSARNRLGDLKPLIGNGIQQVLKGPGSVLHRGQDDFFHSKLADHLVQAADVVGMGMGSDHIVQLSDPGLLQIPDDGVRLVVFPCVNEHEMPVRLDQYAVPLPHVNKMDP